VLKKSCHLDRSAASEAIKRNGETRCYPQPNTPAGMNPKSQARRHPEGPAFLPAGRGISCSTQPRSGRSFAPPEQRLRSAHALSTDSFIALSCLARKFHFAKAKKNSQSKHPYRRHGPMHLGEVGGARKENARKQSFLAKKLCHLDRSGASEASKRSGETRCYPHAGPLCHKTQPSRGPCYAGRMFNFGKPKTAGDWIVHVAGAIVAIFLVWWVLRMYVF
jgi:hypothetical protein